MRNLIALPTKNLGRSRLLRFYLHLITHEALEPGISPLVVKTVVSLELRIYLLAIMRDVVCKGQTITPAFDGCRFAPRVFSTSLKTPKGVIGLDPRAQTLTS
jgi:hypothetical protein